MILQLKKGKNLTWISGRFGATFIKTSLLASNIPVRNPWLYVKHQMIKISMNFICINLKTNLENCPRIAGMEPLYNPWSPISGSFDTTSGNESVDACTRVYN